MDAATIVTGLRRRHESSTQTSSKTLVATIDAINETLEAQGIDKSITAYLGACMSPLEQAVNLPEADSVTALCTVLATVLQHLPSSYIASKFGTIADILIKVVNHLKELNATAGLKSALQCLVHALGHASAAASSWPRLQPPFVLLINFTMHANSKARKVAQDGLAEVLAVWRTTAALAPASQDVTKVSKMVLTAPKLAAQAAAEATKSKREAAEEAIMRSVQDCLHFMGALRAVLPVLSEAAALEIAELLLKLFALSQPLLSQHAADCLCRVAQGARNTGNVAPDKLALLLKATLPQLDSQRDGEVLMRLVRFVEEACIAIARAAPAAVAPILPSVFLALAPVLTADSDGARRAAAEALRSVTSTCIMPELVASAAVDARLAPGPPQGLARCVMALTKVLSPGYQDAWPMAMPIVGDMFQKLGREGAVLARPLLLALADLCRGSADAVEYSSQAQSAMGAAIAAQSPRAVLDVLPLDLDNLVEADTWLLPLLKRHTVSAEMAFWGEYMMPKARVAFKLASLAQQTNQSVEHVKLSALELQIWNCLAAFANWAPDVPAAFESFGETLGKAFQARTDLQAPICNALRRVCAQTSAALRAAGDRDGVGYNEGTTSTASMHGVDSEDEDAGSSHEPASSLVPPEGYDLSTATRNRAALRGVAQKWLTELLRRFVSSPPEERGIVGETITAFATVAGEASVVPFFKECLKKVIAALQELQGGSGAAEGGVVLGDPALNVTTYLDLALLLAPGLPDSAMQPLFKAVRLGLSLSIPAAQKRAYKALAYLVTRRSTILRGHLTDLLTVLMAGATSVEASARRYRLSCIIPVVLVLSSPDCPDVSAVQSGAQGGEGGAVRAVVTSLVAELVLATKEVNKKTRAQAYAVLVGLAHALHEVYPPSGRLDALAEASSGSLDDGGLQRLFAMVLAGVAASTPRMLSASVMALARLVFDFASQLQVIAASLLPVVCALLRSKSREIVKAVLGFLKVAVVRVPQDLLEPHLRLIIEGVLLWAEDSKNRFKSKVRFLVERLCKRCGYDAVAAVWPETDAKLLTAVRKDAARKARKKAHRADADDDGASQSSAGRTARTSAWAHTAVFSDDDDDDGGADGEERHTVSARTAKPSAKSKASSRHRAGSFQGRLADGGDEPVDLLHMGTARSLARSAAGVREEEPVVDDYARGDDGRMVIKEDTSDPFAWKKNPKRKLRHVLEENESDLEDMQGVAGLDAAYKKTANADSLKHAGKYAHSMRSGATRRSAATSRGSSRSKAHDSGAAKKFKAKKGAAGDAQGDSKVEPYAYWRLDKQLLNSRNQKSRGARQRLGGLVTADAPARGRKAKKARVS